MTLALGLYYALIVLWLPLAAPAVRLRGAARILLLVTMVLGALALAHEIRMTFWTPEAIRLDIFLIAIMLGGLYVASAVTLYFKRWRRSSAALGAMVVIIALGIGYEVVRAGREAAQLTANFNAGNAMMFAAMFRDRETYDSVFGPFGPGGDELPVGHWQADEGAPYPRLIVNARGLAWLFYRCPGTECAVAPAGTALRPDNGGAGTAAAWRAELAPRIGPPWPVTITRAGPDRLSVAARGQEVAMTRTAPPIPAVPKPKRLAYLGRFAAIACRGAHADVRQLWLWREGDQLFAVGVFRILLHGREARFVTPIVLGEGAKGATGWRFSWSRDGRKTEATVAIEGEKVTLELTRPGRAPVRSALAAKPVFEDPTIELAPLTGAEDWAHWFEVVLAAHFTSGRVPPCPATGAKP